MFFIDNEKPLTFFKCYPVGQARAVKARISFKEIQIEHIIYTAGGEKTSMVSSSTRPRMLQY